MRKENVRKRTTNAFLHFVQNPIFNFYWVRGDKRMIYVIALFLEPSICERQKEKRLIWNRHSPMDLMIFQKGN